MHGGYAINQYRLYMGKNSENPTGTWIIGWPLNDSIKLFHSKIVETYVHEQQNIAKNVECSLSSTIFCRKSQANWKTPLPTPGACLYDRKITYHSYKLPLLWSVRELLGWTTESIDLLLRPDSPLRSMGVTKAGRRVVRHLWTQCAPYLPQRMRADSDLKQNKMVLFSYMNIDAIHE